MRFSSIPGCMALLVVLVSCSGAPPVEDGAVERAADDGALPPPRVKVIDTGPLHIDRILASMDGPHDRLELDTRGLDWVTSFRTGVVDAGSGDPMGDEFFCHAQMQLLNETRLLTTATGSEQIRFPPGFGMPVNQILSGLDPERRTLTLLGMVLNNHVPHIDRLARVRWHIEYYTNLDVGSPPRLKKLYKLPLPMTVEDLEAYERPMQASHSSSAMEGEDDLATHCVLVEGLKVHWLVPPGPQRTRRRLEKLLPVDATVHYGVVHMHNHGVYMRVSDVTTGEVLWHTDVIYEEDRVQITKIPVYSSVEGFKMYRDHVYEIEAFYLNATDHDIDAMASMDLYYHPDGDEDIYYPDELQGG